MPNNSSVNPHSESCAVNPLDMLEYQSRTDLSSIRPLRAKWLVILAVVLFVGSFFLPTVQILSGSEPGWWAAYMTFSMSVAALAIAPEENGLASLLMYDMWVHSVGASANLTFLLGLTMFMRAASHRGRLLGRTTRSALCFSAISFFSAAAFLTSLAPTHFTINGMAAGGGGRMSGPRPPLV